ncbi:MAG TPA: prepilin-type N-terminal cleavage/methylation domain-containing protein [Planctomycetota bacterium]|nr:prepilin-type N-terminal cleavage/methylation domain-containing protein [Planctomycetota bacterium]
MIVGKNRRGPKRSSRGLTLVELAMAMTLLAIALVGYAKTVANASVATSTSREVVLASEAGRRMIETLRSEDFATIFARYNSSVADDPGGVVSPGANFAITGLDAIPIDVDGRPGEIIFPVTLVGGAPQLLENVVDTKLGMPSDLNGDGIIDGIDRATTAPLYQNLPVIIRVRWRGIGGPGVVEFQTVLGDI